MRIGVFDSGIGGLSVAHAIQQALPETEVLYTNDEEHVPYGDKTAAEMLSFVLPILEALVDEGCAVIVIACNSVTTNLITELRKRIAVPLIGMEPMVKSAAELTRSNVIAVCATPATLKSKRYAMLKEFFAENVNVLEPDCSRWAFMIEQNNLNEDDIFAEIERACTEGADVIVLGCTHYHWIEEEIRTIAAGRAEVLQPEQPVIAQLKRVIAQLP